MDHGVIHHTEANLLSILNFQSKKSAQTIPSGRGLL